MSKKRLELFKANRRPIESQFAQGPFWTRAREHPDFGAIRDAYVDGVLMASLASRAADLANRVEVPEGKLPERVPIQGTRTAKDSEDLNRITEILKAASRKVRPFVENHYSNRTTDDLLVTRSSYVIDVLIQLRKIAKKRRRYGRIEGPHARMAMQDVIEKRERITYEVAGQRFDLDPTDMLKLVLDRPDLVQKIVSYCNGGSALNVAAEILAAEQGTKNITRDVLRSARGRAKSVKTRRSRVRPIAPR